MAWFPALRQVDPALHRVIDRLEADRLMAHLDYEEEQLNPTLRRITA